MEVPADKDAASMKLCKAAHELSLFPFTGRRCALSSADQRGPHSLQVASGMADAIEVRIGGTGVGVRVRRQCTPVKALPLNRY